MIDLLESNGEDSNNSSSFSNPKKKAHVVVESKQRFFISTKNESYEENNRESERMDIAVIGISGRYPQAETLDEFWENLCKGRNCITEVPKGRWDWNAFYHKDRGKVDSIYSKWGGFIEGIDLFDPLFFQIAPREAERMDPQERLFLETAYSSIEDAGYTPNGLSETRKIGVFVGVMNANYPTTSSYWSIANRVSFVLNFRETESRRRYGLFVFADGHPSCLREYSQRWV